MLGYVVHSSQTCYPLFQQLEGCVRGGHNGWRAAFGMSGAEVSGGRMMSCPVQRSVEGG